MADGAVKQGRQKRQQKRRESGPGVPHTAPAASEYGEEQRHFLPIRAIPVLITVACIALALPFSWAMWREYMGAPWTRDSTVRAYVVTMAPEVAGRIVARPVADNQYVHKGDLLLAIDPTDYKIAVSLAEAAVRQAQVNARIAAKEATRRRELIDLAAVAVEQQQKFEAQAAAADAQLQQAVATLAQARVNLDRTQIRAPVNGWITNLLANVGDYGHVGQNEISVVDADSFWLDGYFEETKFGKIHMGDPAKIKLMGYPQILHGRVSGVARAINVANAQPNQEGVATVNPIFTWVRLAQRIPVHIRVDPVPEGVVLVAGMTATVQIDAAPKASAP
jgi:RND family efflux transporter MFP subunit